MGGEPRVSKFSFNPAAKEFTPSSMPSGFNAVMSPQARSRPQRIPEWKPSNKIRDDSPTPTSWGERKKVSNKISPWIRSTPPTVTSPGGSNGSGANSSSTSFQVVYPLPKAAPVTGEERAELWAVPSAPPAAEGQAAARNVSPEPQKDSTPPRSKEEQPVPSEPRASPETLVEEARKLLAAMVNTGRANGKLEEVLAGMHPKAKEVVTLCRYAGILKKPQGASEESR